MKRKAALAIVSLTCVGRSPQPFDRGEGVLVQITGTGLRRMGQAAAGRGLLAEAVFAGEHPAGERAEGGIAEAMLGAVRDQRLRIRGGEQIVLVLDIFKARGEAAGSQSSDRLHIGQRRVGDAEAGDFACFDSTRHGLERLFEGVTRSNS